MIYLLISLCCFETMNFPMKGNNIRGMIRKYIAENNISQAEFLKRIQVNSNTYYKFMNAKYYKNEWSAVSNGTYAAAGGFIALDAIVKKIAALETKKSDDKILSGKKRAAPIEETVPPSATAVRATRTDPDSYAKSFFPLSAAISSNAPCGSGSSATATSEKKEDENCTETLAGPTQTNMFAYFALPSSATATTSTSASASSSNACSSSGSSCSSSVPASCAVSSSSSSSSGTTSAAAPPAPRAEPPKKKTKEEIRLLIDSITAIEVPEDVPIYANCDEVRKMIDKFIQSSGVNQTTFLKAIGCAANSYGSFRGFRGKGAGAGNSVYWKSYRFFEQQRMLEGTAKSKRRLEQEERWGARGFARKHDDGTRWVLKREDGDTSVNNDIFDIEKSQDILKAQVADGDEMALMRFRHEGFAAATDTVAKE